MSTSTHQREIILDQLFDKYFESEDSINENLMARLCASDPDLLNALRTMVLKAIEGQTLLSPLVSPPITQLHETHPTFKDIELIEPIGQGGYGCVYRGTQRNLEWQRDVAVKFFHHSLFSRDSFERETVTLKALGNAKNVPCLHAWGEHAGYWYLVLDWIPGLSLEEVITHRRETCGGQSITDRIFSEQETIQVLKSILSVLSGLYQEYRQYTSINRSGNTHSEGLLIHGDLKPANILLRQEQFSDIWIVDFGVSQMVGESPLGLTENYVSPEMCLPVPLKAQRQLSQQSDIFQVGLIGFELLTGRAYWDLEAEERAILLSRFPIRLRTALTRALAWNPTDRFSTVDEFFRQLTSHSGFRIHLEYLVRHPTPWVLTACMLAFAFLWLAERFDTLETSHAALIQEHSFLKNKSGQLQDKVNKLSRDIQDKTLEIAKLEGEKTSLETQLSKYEGNQFAFSGGSGPLLGDNRKRYKDIKERLDKLADRETGKDHLIDDEWRRETRGELDAYIKDFGKSAFDRRQVDAAINWLDSIDSRKLTISLQPVSFEEFTYWPRLFKNEIGYKIFHDGQEIADDRGWKISGKKTDMGIPPVTRSWSWGQQIEIQLWAATDAPPLKTVALLDLILERILEGHLSSGHDKLEWAIETPSRKIIFQVMLDGDFSPPPYLADLTSIQNPASRTQPSPAP